MDELPVEARDLLRLAADAHNPPDPEARARVRRGVAMAIGAGVGASVAGHAVAQGAVKGGLLSGLAGKLTAAGVAVAVASTVVLTLPAGKPEPTQSKAVASHSLRTKHAAEALSAKQAEEIASATAQQLTERARVAKEQGVQSPVAPEQGEAEAQYPQPGVRKVSQASRHASVHTPARDAESKVSSAKASAPSAVDPLRAEMSLLSHASQALTRGDLAGAEQALSEHRETFRTSVLSEERDGLTALLGCSQDPQRARRQAERFIARAPRSVLAQRVSRACKLGEDP